MNNGKLPVGVYLISKGTKNKYGANITILDEKIYLGAFSTPEGAHTAFCLAFYTYHNKIHKRASKHAQNALKRFIKGNAHE